MNWQSWADPPNLERAVMRDQVKARLLGQPPAGIPLGRFQLLRLLGRGTSGSVYEARDTETELGVAIKVLRTQAVRDVQRFKREFRSLTHVVHDNLVQLYELFATPEQWYFSMELVRGTNFVDYVRDSPGPVAWDTRRLHAALGQLLSAVQAIHDAQQLHCDLKPSNVLVGDEGRVVVLDFGLLRPSEAITSTVQAIPRSARGTPAYMAPELRRGAAHTPASDVYAVGVMLYQAISGRLPMEDSLAERRRSLEAEVPAELVALCDAMLDSDPTRRPTIDSARDALRLAGQEARTNHAGPSSPHFAGRESELQHLNAALEAAQAGRPVAIFIHGTSGIGKSALADHFAQTLAGAVTVLRARCYERESLPYKAFDGLVDALQQHLRARTDPAPTLPAHEAAALMRVFPSLASCLPADSSALAGSSLADVQELRQRAFLALKRLLHQLAAERALVLMVDDLQWADRDSARLLMELLGPPHAPALLYVGCYRDEETLNSEFLTELANDAHWQCERRSLPLGPLAHELASSLARALLPLPAEQCDAAAMRIAHEAQGVPLFIVELAAYLLHDLSHAATALSLSDLLARRVLGLSLEERRVLTLLSLAARPLAPRLLLPAFEDPTSFQRSLRVLSVQRLVHSDAHGRMVVYHDQLRELLSSRLSTDSAAELHRVLALAYERMPGVEPEWLIEHWRYAGESTRALQYALSAAELAAQKLAFNRAVALYGTALDLEGDVVARRRLHAMLAEALVNAGRGAAAAHAFLNAVDPGDVDGARALRCRAAQQFLRTGHKAEADALLEPLFAEVSIRYPRNVPEVVLRLVASRLKLASWSALKLPRVRHASARVSQRLVVLGAVFRECSIVDPLRGLLFQSEFYESALRSDQPSATFIGFAWDTYNQATLGGWKKRHAIAKRLARLEHMAAALDTHYAQAIVLLMRGSTGLQMGDWRAAAEFSGRARKLFREHCPGANWEEAISSYVNCAGMENVGPISAMLHDAPIVVRNANERVDQLTDALLSVTMGSALLAEDKPGEARAFMEERLARLTGDMDLQLFGVISRTIDAALYARDGERAWELYERLWPDFLRSGFDRTELFSGLYRMRRARAALLFSLQRGDTRLHPIVEQQIKKLERVPRPDLISIAEGLKGALAFQRHELARAREHLRVSIASAERAGLCVSALCTRMTLGRLTPGPEGEQQLTEAATALRAQGVVNPDRWSELYITGFSAV